MRRIDAFPFWWDLNAEASEHVIDGAQDSGGDGPLIAGD
jgi:hypothetical protein